MLQKLNKPNCLIFKSMEVTNNQLTVSQNQPKAQQALELQQIKEGSQTNTPARPKPQDQAEHQEDQAEHREDNAQCPEDKDQNKDITQKITPKQKKIIATVIIILVVLSIAIVLTVILVNLNKPKSTAEVKSKMVYKFPASKDNSRYSLQKIQVTDQTLLGPGKKVDVYTTEVKQKATGKSRLLQDTTTKTSTSIECRDVYTGTIVGLRSESGEITAEFSITQLLAYIFTNQPLPEDIEGNKVAPANNLQTDESNSDSIQLQPSPIIYKTVILSNINQLFQEKIKAHYSKKDANAKADIQSQYEGKYQKNEQDNFRIVPPTQPLTYDQKNIAQIATFHDPNTTIVITNYLNQEKIADAAVDVAVKVVENVKAFLQAKIPDIESATGIDLPVKDLSNGEPSIFKEEATDLDKLCSAVEGNTIRCPVGAWESGLIKVNQPLDGILPNEIPVVSLVTTI